MKKLTVLLLCIIAIMTAIPFGIGIITQERSESLNKYYSQNPNIRALNTAFQRGLFHSNILSELSIYLPDINDKPLDFNVHQYLRQGPILWGNNQPLAFGFADMKTIIELPSSMQNALTQNLGESPTITLLTQLHYDGSQDSQLSMPEFSHENDGKHIIIQPLSLHAHSDLPVKHIQAILEWQGMNINDTYRQVHIGKSVSHIDAQKESIIWIGNMDWSSDFVDFNNHDQRLTMKDVSVHAKTSIDKQQRVSSSQSFNLTQLKSNNSEYGPGQFTLTLNHIPLRVFEKVDEMQQKISAMPAEQQHRAMQNMGFSMFSLLPDILAAEPEIKLHHAQLNTPNGDVKAEVYITVKGLDEQDMMNFTKIKQHIRADMQLQFPEALLTQSNQQIIKGLLKKGWLIKKGTMLHSTLHMLDGVLTINEQNITLPL